MARFLVCWTLCESFGNIFLKVYKLNYATTPDEVSYPDSTVMFAFVEGIDENDILSNFCSINLGNVNNVTMTEGCFSKPESIIGNTVYFVGKKIFHNNYVAVFNESLGSLIPISNSIPKNMNYEIIEP